MTRQAIYITGNIICIPIIKFVIKVHEILQHIDSKYIGKNKNKNLIVQIKRDKCKDFFENKLIIMIKFIC